MDEETQLSRFQAPPTLDHIGCFVPDGAQEGEVGAIEISQALDVGKKHQGNEVQGRKVGEVPLHVWQDEEAEGVRLR